MRRCGHAIAAAALLAAAGCKGKSEPAEQGQAPAAAGGDAAAAAPMPPPPPEPAAALTPMLLLKARGLVVAGTPWSEAYERLTTILGEPSLVEGSAHWWAALDGAACVGLLVDRSGDVVGTVLQPQRVEPAAGKYFETCRRAAAGEPDPSDPAAGDVTVPSGPPDIEIPTEVHDPR